MKRPGYAPHHASRCQSLYARIAASASSSSFGHIVRRWPTKPGRNDGKHSDAAHAVDVHVGDARVDVPRAAPHLVEAGRLEAVLGRRPADHRVEADVRQHLALPHPRFAAVVGRRRRAVPSSAYFFGNRPVNASGGSTTWSSTEITVYTRSRGSGSGSHVIVSRRPLPPPKYSLLARSSSDMPASCQHLGFVAEQQAHRAVPVRLRRVLVQQRLQRGARVGGHLVAARDPAASVS